MTDAHLATQQSDLCIVEYLGDKAHAPMGAYGLPVMYRDSGGLLSPVLQGIEGIINGLSYTIARLIEGNSDNAAGIVQLLTSNNQPFSSTCDFPFAAWLNYQSRSEHILFS